MTAVVPGCGGQLGVRSGRVFGVGGVGGVGGVERGVKTDRVVGVAGQGAQRVMVGIAQGVADREGQQRVRADLDECGVSGTGSGHRLAEPHRVTQVGHPVLGITGWVAVDTVDGAEHRDCAAGRQPGQPGPQLRQDRVDDAVMGGDIDIDAAGQPVVGGHCGDDGLDLVERAGDHGLPREAYTAIATSG